MSLLNYNLINSNNLIKILQKIINSDISSNKRIAQNTAVLYIRLIIVTIIGLYVARVVLLALGVDNYGLYSVVGGMVTIMNSLSASMSATSYRFLAIELGKGEHGNPNKIFNSVLVIHIALTTIFVLFAEAIGVWYIKNYLNISLEKIPDALFVLHLSIAATVFAIMNIPFSGLITAKERFVFTSFTDIAISIVKLTLIILLSHSEGNKLRTYAIIMAIIMLVQPAAYFIYCKIKENSIIKWNLNKDWHLYKTILGFAWWAIFGTAACIGQSQGAAIVINWFFNTALNAAFGVATQVNNMVMMFVRNLNQATIPQIMKSQSAGESQHALSLVYRISKYTYFIMLIPSIPLILSMESILGLWLKNVPDFTKQFAILMLINGLINCLGSGFDSLIQATGKIRSNQIGYSIITFSILPLAYFMYKLGSPPYIITVVTIFTTIIVLIFQTYILKHITNFNITHYLKETIYPSFIVSLIIIPQFLIQKLFGHSILISILLSSLSILFTAITIYFAGLTLKERNWINNYLVHKL